MMDPLQSFYDYCDANNVDVMSYSQLPADACTVRDHSYYCVVFNPTTLNSFRRLRTAVIHEEGHLRTGALHKVDSPYQLVAQAEYRADAESFRRYLPPNKIGAAMRAGYTEPWQLADYFDLDEDYIKKALHYCTECKAIRFDAEMGAE